MTEHTYIKISSDHENGVQNFIHEMRKQADEGQRFGVDISIERVDPNDFAEVDFE